MRTRMLVSYRVLPVNRPAGPGDPDRRGRRRAGRVEVLWGPAVCGTVPPGPGRGGGRDH
jgi:hypothetical protein